MNTIRVNTTAWRQHAPNHLENSAKDFYRLYFSPYDSYASIVLPSFLLLIATLIFSFSKPSNRTSKPCNSLQALFTVVAPTSVAWPREYARLVTHSASSRSRTIAISMNSLIDNVCDGTIEVRSYADLPELFAGKLVVYGWRVSLALDTLWTLAELRWVVGTHFWWTQSLSVTKNTPGASKPKTDIPAACLSFSLTSNAHLDLDYIPFSRLEASLLQLRTGLEPGSIANLEFTAPSSEIAFLSTQFNICAVPFLPRKYARNGTAGRDRTATPLLSSVHRVLELLTAGPSALVLESASNVSKTYADGLNAAGEHLEEDTATRTAFIQQWGVAGWREQRLMMAWEAALFSVGYLARWIVVVRK